MGGMDIGMMIAIACVIIMPVIIIRLAKQIKKVQQMKAESAADKASAGSGESADK